MRNGKIMCNHGVNLFKCQTCIDVLVAERIEVMQRQNDELVARVARLVAGLEHIAEYWNQDRNDQAMFDALMHIEDEVHLLIDEIPTQSLQHIEAAAVERFITAAIKAGELVNDHSVIQKLRQQSTNGDK